MRYHPPFSATRYHRDIWGKTVPTFWTIFNLQFGWLDGPSMWKGIVVGGTVRWIYPGFSRKIAAYIVHITCIPMAPNGVLWSPQSQSRIVWCLVLCSTCIIIKYIYIQIYIYIYRYLYIYICVYIYMYTRVCVCSIMFPSIFHEYPTISARIPYVYHIIPTYPLHIP